jgi:hypothetical protein
MLYMAKHMVGMLFATGEHFTLHFDVNAPGVYAGLAEEGILQFGEGVLQSHIDCSRDELSAHLSFAGSWLPVRIPWRAIRRIIPSGKTGGGKPGAGATRPSNPRLS